MENQRRYLTYDILCGKFNEAHPLYNHFMHLGITAEELHFFVANACPPDLLGVNYYCTSERFLDEDLHKYPTARHGGNTLHEYADVEAVRVKFDEPHGFKVLMRELWDRYSIPIAVTEAHLHCSREGQMQWFLEIYESACELATEGINVKSVTAWSVLGSYGWNQLLTSDTMEYERGTFDVSSGKRRPTAMASVIKSLVDSGTYNNQVLHGKPWWHRESRYFDTKQTTDDEEINNDACRPILIFGKTGTLGNAFAKVCRSRALKYVLASRNDADICDATQLHAVIQKYNPWAIVNAAGYVRVDDAESDQEKCMRENTTGAIALAKTCAANGIQYLTFSTDLVFDGNKNAPYVESDLTNPLNVYGKSKADAESAVLDILPSALIIRTSAFFGPWDEHNFAYHVLQQLEKGDKVYASSDIISPTYVPHLVDASIDLLIDCESGIYHLTNNDAISWADFAREIAKDAGFDVSLIVESNPNLPAQRPKYSVLNSEKGKFMPSLSSALGEFLIASPTLIAS